jgi:hypothetical protein
MGWTRVACRRMSYKKSARWKAEWKKTHRRPQQRWFDTVKKDLTRVDPTYNINLAIDRMHWRGIVEAALDLNGLF